MIGTFILAMWIGQQDMFKYWGPGFHPSLTPLCRSSVYCVSGCCPSFWGWFAGNVGHCANLACFCSFWRRDAHGYVVSFYFTQCRNSWQYGVNNYLLWHR